MTEIPSSPAEVIPQAGAGTLAAQEALDSEILWKEKNWLGPIQDFSRASGLTVSILDAEGRRRLGPVSFHPLFHLLREAGAWERGGICDLFEAEVAAQASAQRQEKAAFFPEGLLVAALPLALHDRPAGSIVFGWVFDHFPDPVRCARLARRFGIPEHLFWSTARQISPTSRERFTVFTSLLKALTQSTLTQMAGVNEARSANRLKDQFLASVSHELRTPLTSMKLRIQLLRRQKNLTPERLEKTLAALEDNVELQEKLVNDLLESTKIAIGNVKLKVEAMRPLEIIEAVVDSVRPIADQKGVQLTFERPVPRHKYEGDHFRLQQVFWNLLQNAVKFTPAGGFVAVSAFEANRAMVIEVRDSGKGIDPENLAHVFDPFFQVLDQDHVANKGLGLGLSIARSIVALHHGKISAESRGAGHGALFRVELPSLGVSLL